MTTEQRQESVEYLKRRLGLVEPTIQGGRDRGAPEWTQQSNTKGWTIPVLVKYAPETMRALWGRGDIAEALKRARLGTGTFAEAFALPDGRVLKVSTDPDDVTVSYHIMGRDIRGIILTELVARIETLSRADLEALEPLAVRRVGLGEKERIPLERDSFHLMIVERVIALDDMPGLMKTTAMSDDARAVMRSAVVAMRSALGALENMSTMVESGRLARGAGAAVMTRLHSIAAGRELSVEAKTARRSQLQHRDTHDQAPRDRGTALFVTKPVEESKEPALAAKYAGDLIEGHATVTALGGSLRDLHEGNVGLSPRGGGMAIILDLGYKSAGTLPEPTVRRVHNRVKNIAR